MRDSTVPEPGRNRRNHDQGDGSVAPAPAASSPDVITVVLIDDNRLVREGIATLLSRAPDIHVVACDSDDYVALVGEVAPNLVLLDLGLINVESLSIAQALHKNHPRCRVILMDLLPAHEDVVEFIEAGVNGFILKDATLDQVLLTMRSVAAGLDVLPDQLAGSLFSEIARETVSVSGKHDPEWIRLTEREREVLDLIAEGLSNKAIARRLHISIHTVKSHLRNTMEKLTLHSRLELATFVHEHSGATQQKSGADRN